MTDTTLQLYANFTEEKYAHFSYLELKLHLKMLKGCIITLLLNVTWPDTV